MLRGAQKRMIVVKTGDSKIFEEAYFVMRGETAVSGEDMVSEANRIIDSCADRRREKPKKQPSALLMSVLMFICGSVIGSVMAVVIMLVS